MKFYMFDFNGDYHIKEDGSHEIVLITVDTNKKEVAYCKGEIVPHYATEIRFEDIPNYSIDL